MRQYIGDPGPWYVFVKRPDNIGRPILEVKQKYLKEYYDYQAELFHVLSTIGRPGSAARAGGEFPQPITGNLYVDPDYVEPTYVE